MKMNRFANNLNLLVNPSFKDLQKSSKNIPEKYNEDGFVYRGILLDGLIYLWPAYLTTHTQVFLDLSSEKPNHELYFYLIHDDRKVIVKSWSEYNKVGSQKLSKEIEEHPSIKNLVSPRYRFRRLNERSVQVNSLYVYLDKFDLEFLCERNSIHTDTFYRTVPKGISIEINRNDLPTIPKPSFRNMEKYQRKIPLSPASKYIKSIHFNTDNLDVVDKYFELIEYIKQHNIHYESTNKNLKHIISLLLKHQKVYEPDEMEIPKDNPSDYSLQIQKFLSLPNKVKHKFCTNISNLKSWFQGYWMEDSDNVGMSFIFKFLSNIIDHDNLPTNELIYRAVYARVEDVNPSPKKYQSWTTNPETAITIAKSNSQYGYGSRKLYLYTTNINDVNVILFVRDLWIFLTDLLKTNFVKYNSSYYNSIVSVMNTIDRYEWQNEIVIMSPFNRKINSSRELIEKKKSLLINLYGKY
ncbi:MAG: hypothetical protein WC284_17020, partial [Candidimonas sp.]